MKKEHYRDYATEAYRFYAQTGNSEKYIQSMVSDSMPVEKAIEIHYAELADLKAVEKVFAMLDMSVNGKYIRQAVEIVYMKDWNKPIAKRDISNRVRYAEIHIPASEPQIYRWLRWARKTFAEERGLRT